MKETGIPSRVPRRIEHPHLGCFPPETNWRRSRSSGRARPIGVPTGSIPPLGGSGPRHQQTRNSRTRVQISWNSKRSSIRSSQGNRSSSRRRRCLTSIRSPNHGPLANFSGQGSVPTRIDWFATIRRRAGPKSESEKRPAKSLLKPMVRSRPPLIVSVLDWASTNPVGRIPWPQSAKSTMRKPGWLRSLAETPGARWEGLLEIY